MSEQTIQDGLFSTPVSFDKYTCRSIGATTIKDLLINKEISGVTQKQCEKIKAKKPDVLILNENKEIVVFIEMKDPSQFKNTQLRLKAIWQELKVAQKVKAKIYMVSDGNDFIWINPNTENIIQDEKGNELKARINPKDLSKEEQKRLGELIDDVCASISSTNDALKPKSYLDPTSLAEKTAKILQNMSLSSAKNSLYTFVEFFTFKFLSDIGVLKGIYSFANIYEVYLAQGSKTAFRQYLTTVREQLLFLFPTNSADDTTIINGRLFHTKTDEKGNPIIIDSAADCFGKLLDCFHEYEADHGKFVYINRDFKSKLFETFMKKSSDKDGMGQFFTPLKVVQEMVRMVDISAGMSICDPACGVGKFLLEASSKIPNAFYFENGTLKQSLSITGLEKRMEDNNDDLTTILAKSNVLIYYSDLFKNNRDSNEKIQQLAEQLLNKVITSSHSTLGTLECLEENKYDLILANPPFYRSAPISAASKSVCIKNSTTKAYTAKGKGIEGLFTEWIIKSLKPGGIANFILPDGIFINIGNKDLRQYIRNNCFIESIISLPVNTFFNTPKKTYILTLRKKLPSELNTSQQSDVFTYLCSSIGESLDVYRFDEPEKNDLKASVDLYCLYKVSKTNPIVLKAIENDPRAKLVKIDFFAAAGNWNIDNIWTEKEKVALGIKKEDDVLSTSEFKSYVDTVIGDMKSYKTVIDDINKDSPTDEIDYAEVPLHKLFTYISGNIEYNKTYCNKHKGEFPVYTATIKEPLGFIDSYEYDGKYLTWTVDGVNSGTVEVIEGKFSTGNGRGILNYQDSSLSPEYLRMALMPMFKKEADGRGKGGTPHCKWSHVKDKKVKIPVDASGNYDLEMQNKLAKYYEKIEAVKDELTKKVDKLASIIVR